MESYSKGLLNSRQLILLKNSFTLALGVSFFSVILGVPFAFLIARTNIPFRNVFKKVYLIPFFLPSYITGVAWIQLLGQRGSLNLWLMRLLHLEEPFFSIYGLPGVIFVLTLNYFPCVTLFNTTVESPWAVSANLWQFSDYHFRLCGAVYPFWQSADYSNPKATRPFIGGSFGKLRRDVSTHDNSYLAAANETWLDCCMGSVICLMGELGTTVLVYPSGLDTLPLLLFNVAHYGPDSLLAALCLILIFVTLLPLFCFSIIKREISLKPYY